MKRSMRLAISAMICFMAFNILPAFAEEKYANEQGKVWICRDLEDGTLEVSGYVGEELTVEIPETIEGKTVTRVAGSPFACANLTTIVLPGSVTEIGANTFEQTAITSVTLPEGLKKIGEEAFAKSGITSITIPESVTEIGKYAFVGCKNLAAVTLPGNLTSISEGMLYGCESLKEITIPESVESIGSEAFENCSSLLSIRIPQRVAYIGQEGDWACFGGCTSLAKFEVAQDNANYSSVDDVLFDKACTRLIRFPSAKKADQYEIPGNVSEIVSGAFYQCGGIKKITISKSVKTIGHHAFDGCKKLKSITIPKGVNRIEEYVFDNCPKLKTIKVDQKNEKYSAKSGVLMNKKQTKLLRCPEGKKGYYIVPTGVTTIGGDAFAHCVNLQGIEVRKNVTKIGGNVFYYHDEEKNYHPLPNLVFERGSYATTYAKEQGVDYTSTVKIKSLKAKTGGFTVKWSKFKYAQGYEIRYATNPEMKNAVKIKVSADKKSKSVKKLTAGQKYYVQVRPYLTDSATEKTVYSVWSKQKSVTAG
ncbi:MAG: leucine-rich repeat domain-containing protein [Lachnospiraceae bacterium]|nr:leucine-rich repeat domain-containing protein [Lachnospiraceae bacterium]